MAVILEERGRGKFKPAPDYKVDEVKELLNAKIEEERQADRKGYDNKVRILEEERRKEEKAFDSLRRMHINAKQ